MSERNNTEGPKGNTLTSLVDFFSKCTGLQGLKTFNPVDRIQLQ